MEQAPTLTDEDNEPKSKALTDEEVFALAKADYEIAKENKKLINGKIAKSKKLYEGKALGNEAPGRSKYVAKESQKAVNWWIPNAAKPFMSSDDVADFSPRTGDDIEKAKSQSTLINYQFNNSFPKYQFLHTALLLYSSEGTVVARTGWLHEEEEEVIPFEGYTDQQIAEIQATGAEVEIDESEQVRVDAMIDPRMPMINIHKGEIINRKVTVSRPDAEPIKNEDFFIIGESIEDSDCCIQRIDTNRSDLRKQDKKYSDKGIYTKVDDITATSTEKRDSDLGQDREEELRTMGQDADNIHSGQEAKDPITIFEYYGKIDRDGDGIAENVVVVWSGSTLLRVAVNPFPDDEPPFVSAPFSPVAFSFWGNGLPFFLEDVTQVKSAIMRTFIDLMANSTNGMKHVQNGTIDTLNTRRLREAKIGTVVEWDDLDGYKPEIQNDIPNALQAMLELFTAEGENESGITRYNQGIDAKSLNKTATGITAIMNQSQMRTWETTTRFAEQFMKPLFRKWIAYNQEFLDTSVAVRVVGNQYTAVSKDDISGEFDLKINVAIAGSAEQKAQKIIQMLQMVQPLVQEQVVPPSHMSKLIAELEELWEFKDLAQELRDLMESQEGQPPAQPGQEQPGQPLPGQPGLPNQ